MYKNKRKIWPLIFFSFCIDYGQMYRYYTGITLIPAAHVVTVVPYDKIHDVRPFVYYIYRNNIIISHQYSIDLRRIIYL